MDILKTFLAIIEEFSFAISNIYLIGGPVSIYWFFSWSRNMFVFFLHMSTNFLNCMLDIIDETETLDVLVFLWRVLSFVLIGR